VIAGISFGEINLASRRSAAGDTGRFQIDRPPQGAPGHVTPSMRCTGRNAANTTTYPNTLRQSRALGRIRLRREASEGDEAGIFFPRVPVSGTPPSTWGLHQPVPAPAVP
jgi:hypothetical protein